METFFWFRFHALCRRFGGVFAGGCIGAAFGLICRKQAAQQVCRLVILLRDGVGVPAERDARAGVPQAGLHGLHVHAVGEKLRGLRVPELVELEPLEAVLLAPDAPPVLEVVDAVPATLLIGSAFITVRFRTLDVIGGQ